MWPSSQGIPNITEIAHLQELIEFSNQALEVSLKLIIIIIF
jgi:hypothetical protein